MWTARSVAACAFVLGLGMTVTPTAAAEDIARDGTIRLVWKAPPDCPTASDVLADARSLLVQREMPAGRGPLSVDAIAARARGNRWTLTLAVGSTKQQLEAASCTDLARAGALFLALLMVPESGPSRSNSASPPPAPAPAAQTPASLESAMASKLNDGPLASEIAATARASAVGPENAATTRAPTGGSARERELSIMGAAGMAVDVGSLPRAGVLGMIAAGIRMRRLELTLQVGAGPPEDTTVNGSVGARLTAASATFEPCYAAWTEGRLRLGPCLPIEGGWIHGQGIGIAQSRSSDSFWWSLGAAIALSIEIYERVEARLDVAALLPLVRPDFTVAGIGRVFEPGVAMRGGTSAVVRF